MLQMDFMQGLELVEAGMIIAVSVTEQLELSRELAIAKKSAAVSMEELDMIINQYIGVRG